MSMDVTVGSAIAKAAVSFFKSISRPDEERNCAHSVCTRIISDSELIFCFPEGQYEEAVAACIDTLQDLRKWLIDVAGSLNAGTYDRGLYDSVMIMKSECGRVSSWHRSQGNQKKIAKVMAGKGKAKEVEAFESFAEHLHHLKMVFASEVCAIAEREGLNLRQEDLDALESSLVIPGL